MPFILLIIGLVMVGALAWIINTILPMHSTMRLILNVLIVSVVVVCVLQFIGIFTLGPKLKIAR